MDAVFLKILNMSLAASLLILAVLPIRLLMKKAPKWTSCLLWLIVAVALVAPVRLESRASMLPVTDPIPMTIVTEEVTNTVPEASDVVVKPSESTVMQSEPTVQPTNFSKALEIGAIVWLFGGISLLGYAMFSYLRLKQRTAVSYETEANVYVCDDIDTPFILGIIRPHIYLPSALDEITVQQVLIHERAHLARKDHWWKPLGYLLLTLHWFNPLVWVAYSLLCTDIELACDEKVIKDMDIGSKKAYSEALLGCSMPRRMIAACPLAFGEVSVKQRISAVLHYKKPAFWVILIVIVVCIALCFGFLTKPIADESTIQYADLNRYINLNSETILAAHTEVNQYYGEYRERDIRPLSDYEELCALLAELSISSRPMAQDSLTRFAEKIISVTTADMGIVEFCFNRTFTEFWVLSSADYSAVYKVRDPSGFRGFFNEREQSNTAAPTEYMQRKRIEMMFSETELGKSAGDYVIVAPLLPYYGSTFAVLAETAEDSNTAYLMQYEITENNEYKMLNLIKGESSIHTDDLHLNVTLGEHTVLWGCLPYEKIYNDIDIIIETTDMTYTVPLYGPAFVACLPKYAEILEVTCSNGKPVSLHFNLNQYDIPENAHSISADKLKAAVENSLNGNSIDVSNANFNEAFRSSNQFSCGAPMTFITSDGVTHHHSWVNLTLNYQNGKITSEPFGPENNIESFMLTDEPVFVTAFSKTNSTTPSYFEVSFNPETGEILSITSYPVEHGADINLTFSV